MNLTKNQLKALKTDNPGVKFKLVIQEQYEDVKGYKPTAADRLGNLGQFPKDLNVNNTITDFTKFQIPYKGQKIALSSKNIAWFRRIITAYEGHTLKENKNGIFIDGKKVTSYTFAMNYY